MTNKHKMYVLNPLWICSLFILGIYLLGSHNPYWKPLGALFAAGACLAALGLYWTVKDNKNNVQQATVPAEPWPVPNNPSAGGQGEAATPQVRTMEAQHDKTYIVVMGDPFEGLSVVGPFENGNKAVRWADLRDQPWWVVPLEDPEV